MFRTLDFLFDGNLHVQYIFSSFYLNYRAYACLSHPFHRQLPLTSPQPIAPFQLSHPTAFLQLSPRPSKKCHLFYGSQLTDFTFSYHLTPPSLLPLFIPRTQESLQSSERKGSRNGVCKVRDGDKGRTKTNDCAKTQRDENIGSED